MRWITFLLCTISINGRCQSPDDSAGVAAAFTRLQAISQTTDHAAAADFICYRGKDKTREWKSPANYSFSDERKGVDGVCERISLLTRNGYQILSFSTEKESEGTWLLLKIQCTTDQVTKNYFFAFLKIKGSYLLGDIDPAH